MSAATRVAGLSTSPIRAIASGASSDTISLALGEPGWAFPQVAAETLRYWSQQAEHCGYGPNSGLSELTDALSTYTGAAIEQIMVTAGSQAAMFAVFQAHVEPGSVVLVPDPGFPAYETLAVLAGATCLRYQLGPAGELDAARLIGALDQAPATSLVVIGHPANPTGGAASAEAMSAVAQRCADTNTTLLSDEVYRELWLDEPQPSIRDVTSHAIVLESVSKGWAAPGLRVGWATGPAALLAPARLIHNAMNTAPARPSQVAAAKLVINSREVLAESRRQVRLRWDVLAAAAPALGPARRPSAGFYYWLQIPEWAHIDPAGFVLRVRDQGRVLVVPGSAFGPAGQHYVRISLGGSLDTLHDGLARLAPWWERQC